LDHAVIGHEPQTAALQSAFASARPHHAWLLTGPQGLGKALFAEQAAIWILAGRPVGEGFTGATDSAAASLIAAGSHPDFRRLIRTEDDKGKLRAVIRVDEVRALQPLFRQTPSIADWRVVIVDSADEMNPQSANALLKNLEEPAPQTLFLVISHTPGRLLPTIRSRCRELRLGPLGPEEMALALAATGEAVADPAALAELSGGSVGEALRLLRLDGLALYAQITALMTTLPRLDRPRALALAEKGAGRGGEAAFDAVLRLIDLFLSRLARTGATGAPPPEAAPGEAALLLRLSPDQQAARVWAELAQTLSLRARHGKAVNLDPAALLMDMVLKIDETAGTLAQR
jgi:DNA polymerase-3 subunit delta'